MFDFDAKKISWCQTGLSTNGHFQIKMALPSFVKELASDLKLEELDELMKTYTNENGIIFRFLKNFAKFTDIEFIVSHRSANNPYEEDGIWHDDGSRYLAYSLSLTTQKVQGGDFLLRKKGADNYLTLPTPSFGTFTVFQTGHNGFEHKVTKVTLGERIISAGWCS